MSIVFCLLQNVLNSWCLFRSLAETKAALDNHAFSTCSCYSRWVTAVRDYMQVVYHVKSRFHQHYHLQGFLNRVRCVMDRDCKKFLEFLVTMTLILKLFWWHSQENWNILLVYVIMKYFFHNSCVVSFEFQNVFKYVINDYNSRTQSTKSSSFYCWKRPNILAVLPKDRIILQRFCILRRFGGTRTPTTCVDSYKCGKANPGWLTIWLPKAINLSLLPTNSTHCPGNR